MFKVPDPVRFISQLVKQVNQTGVNPNQPYHGIEDIWNDH